MKSYIARCTCCGRVNLNLFLEETEGFFECDACGTINHIEEYEAIKDAYLTRRDIPYGSADTAAYVRSIAQRGSV